MELIAVDEMFGVDKGKRSERCFFLNIFTFIFKLFLQVGLIKEA